jgi:hypothetical protein
MNAEFPNDLWHAPNGAFSPVLIIGVEYGGVFGARAPPEILHRGLSPCRCFAELIAVNVVICFFGLSTEIWY